MFMASSDIFTAIVTDTVVLSNISRFHNREVLVISALQVEKNPVTTPGPFATPPPQRNIFQNTGHALCSMTPPLGVQRAHVKGGAYSCTNSPRIGDYFRSTTRPHSSPKLKLRSIPICWFDFILFRFLAFCFALHEKVISNCNIVKNEDGSYPQVHWKVPEESFIH